MTPEERARRMNKNEIGKLVVGVVVFILVMTAGRFLV